MSSEKSVDEILLEERKSCMNRNIFNGMFRFCPSPFEYVNGYRNGKYPLEEISGWLFNEGFYAIRVIDNLYWVITLSDFYGTGEYTLDVFDPLELIYGWHLYDHKESLKKELGKEGMDRVIELRNLIGSVTKLNKGKEVVNIKHVRFTYDMGVHRRGGEIIKNINSTLGHCLCWAICSGSSKMAHCGDPPMYDAIICAIKLSDPKFYEYIESLDERLTYDDEQMVVDKCMNVKYPDQNVLLENCRMTCFKEITDNGEKTPHYDWGVNIKY